MNPENTNEIPAPVNPEGIPEFPDFGHVPLKGSENTRDLGGMPAADGKIIARGRLIRSGALADLREEDAAVLELDHDLKRIVDLRTSVEQQGSADRTDLMPNVEVFHMPVFKEEAVGITHGDTGSLKTTMKSALSNSYDRMVGLYKKASTADEAMEAYSNFLDLLLNAEEGATLWHCTEGKDRVGISSYLVEYILGVPEEYRRADYLATNLFNTKGLKAFIERMANSPANNHLAKKAEAFFFAYEDYLNSALDSINEKFGSMDAYLAEGLSFGSEKQARLRELYLIDPE